jgi:hypothetical protein
MELADTRFIAEIRWELPVAAAIVIDGQVSVRFAVRN